MLSPILRAVINCLFAQGAIWSVCVRPDDRGMVTGSADKTVKFWDFELKAGAARQLTVTNTRAITLTDEVGFCEHIINCC